MLLVSLCTSWKQKSSDFFVFRGYTKTHWYKMDLMEFQQRLVNNLFVQRVRNCIPKRIPLMVYMRYFRSSIPGKWYYFSVGAIHLVRTQNIPKSYYFLPPDTHTLSFGLNTKIYDVNLDIQSSCERVRIRGKEMLVFWKILRKY